MATSLLARLSTPLLPRFHFSARLLIALSLACAASSPLLRAADSSAGSPSVPIESRDPWAAADLIEPAALAKSLAAPASAATDKPTVLCVGFSMLYRGAHIPGAKLAGPTKDADGIQALTSAVKGMAHDQPIVIYCGCCPWDHCPNIRPAFRALHDLGYRNVKLLVIPSNFHDDWVTKGLPVAKGA